MKIFGQELKFVRTFTISSVYFHLIIALFLLNQFAGHNRIDIAYIFILSLGFDDQNAELKIPKWAVTTSRYFGWIFVATPVLYSLFKPNIDHWISTL
jgi:hypothetical protein